MAHKCWLAMALAILPCLGGCDRDGETPQPGLKAGRPPQELKAERPEARTIRVVRQPAVAGLFYPDSEKDLAQQVDRYLADVKAEPIKNLRGLIAPHAGYEYSGPVAAVAYKQLQGRDINTVVVMAPSHYADFEGASIPEVDAYETPLGRVPLALRADELAGVRPFVRNPPCEVGRPGWWRQARMEIPPFGEDTPHTWEHSLEVQLPFLQRTLEQCAIIPIVFCRVDPEEAAEALEPFVDEKTMLVASSDLSHHKPYETAKHLDASCISAILDLDVERMEDEDACGKTPILTLMHLAKKKGWQAKLLDYRNSGDTAGDKSAVVGYAAIAFFEPASGESSTQTPAALTQEDAKILLELAEKTVRQVVTDGTQPTVDPAGLPEGLGQPRACFVTLTKDGQLRGCIGSIFPQEPLCQAVVLRARSAATEDPRFPRVQPEELDQLEIEVSVLSIPKRLEFDSPEELVKRLRPHTDGVVLRRGQRQSTYLPQVWEKLPDPETFLNRLAEKAGLYPSAWKDPGLTILTYQVRAFKQSEM